MSKSSKTVLPLALLTCFALAGCDSRSKADAEVATGAVAETAAEETVAPENQPTSGSQAQDEGTADASAGNKSLNRGQQMLDQIKAFLQPDVIGPTLEKNLANFQETLNGITDAASATEALPQLMAFQKSMEQLNTVVAMVPAESRPILAEKLNAAAGPIKQTVDKLYQDEGTAKIVRPVFSQAMKKFDVLLRRFPVESAESEDAIEDAEADATETAEVDATETVEVDATETAPSE